MDQSVICTPGALWAPFDYLIGWTISWLTVSDTSKRFIKIDADFLEGGADVNIIRDDPPLIQRLEELRVSSLTTKGSRCLRDRSTELLARTSIPPLTPWLRY